MESIGQQIGHATEAIHWSNLSREDHLDRLVELLLILIEDLPAAAAGRHWFHQRLHWVDGRDGQRMERHFGIERRSGKGSGTFRTQAARIDGILLIAARHHHPVVEQQRGTHLKVRILGIRARGSFLRLGKQVGYILRELTTILIDENF